MSPSTQPDSAGANNDRRAEPTISEIAALTRRLRELSALDRHADPSERAAFIADKEALLARIPGHDPEDSTLDAGHEADDNADEDEPVTPKYGPGESYCWRPGGSARLDPPHPDVLPPDQCVPGDGPLAARIAELQGHTMDSALVCFPRKLDDSDDATTDDGDAAGWSR